MSALADGTAVLFGGWDGGALLNDVYTLTVSGTSATWASLSSDGATPSGRSSHSMTALADGTVVLFGGYDGALLNDVYTLTVSGTSATWASLSIDGATPSGRYYHTMTALADGTAVLFGGYDGARLNDVYTLTVSGTSATWTSLSSDGATPSVRSEHSMTALADGTAVLFGGRESSWADKNDVDTLTVSGTSATWASLSSDGADSKRTIFPQHDGACRWHTGPLRRLGCCVFALERSVHTDAPHSVPHSVSYGIAHDVAHGVARSVLHPVAHGVAHATR